MTLKQFKFLKSIPVALMIAALSSSCALMIPDGSYFADFDKNALSAQSSGGYFSPGQDFPVVTGDVEPVKESPSRGPATITSSRYGAESESLREELQSKVANLGMYERERYLKASKFLESDSDKLYYLSLDASEQRDYLNSKKDDQNAGDFAGLTLSRRSVHSSDIYLGMDKDEVVQVWGKPARIEIAGHPTYENERWSFVEDGTVKQVYFEGGRVHGWALDL